MIKVRLPRAHIAGRYRGDGTDRCPNCDRSQWIIGRSTAECAFCSTAIPLAEATRSAAPRFRCRGSGGGKTTRMMAA